MSIAFLCSIYNTEKKYDKVYILTRTFTGKLKHINDDRYLVYEEDDKKISYNIRIENDIYNLPKNETDNKKYYIRVFKDKHNTYSGYASFEEKIALLPNPILAQENKEKMKEFVKKEILKRKFPVEVYELKKPCWLSRLFGD